MTQAHVLSGRYELGELLGRGGMADVHRARDRVLHRDVAVKLMRDSADDATDRARFTAEARTLAALSHHGLVTVLDAGIEESQPYLVMELVAGTTLADAISRGPVPPRRAEQVAVQLADALGYAHAHGVVHRDVKPANVLIRTDGAVKLADFGIARLIGDAAGHTRTGQAIGTAAYLAPEQVMGSPVSGATDVYALGLVLLESLTGVRAYPGPPTEAALARLLHHPPDVPASLPEEWRRLLTAMTAQEPSDRPSASEVGRVLRALPDDSTRTAVRGPLRPEPDGAGGTRVLTELGTVVSPAPAPEAPGTSSRPGRTVGGAVGAAARSGQTAWRRASPGARAVAVVGVILLLLLVVVALAADTGGGEDPQPIPANTPERLRAPLEELHGAVEDR